VSGSGINWTICKSAPRSRQIAMPAPHRSVFYRWDALPATQPTSSKHWRQTIITFTLFLYHCWQVYENRARNHLVLILLNTVLINHVSALVIFSITFHLISLLWHASGKIKLSNFAQHALFYLFRLQTDSANKYKLNSISETRKLFALNILHSAISSDKQIQHSEPKYSSLFWADN